MANVRRLLDFADDRVIVSGRVWFPDEGDFVSGLRIEPVRLVRGNGRVGVDLKTRESIEGNDSVVRQESFERAVESHLDALQSAGLGSDFFADSSAEVAIYVSLAPHHGQAGVVVPPPLMSRLVQLDASLFVDSLEAAPPLPSPESRGHGKVRVLRDQRSAEEAIPVAIAVALVVIVGGAGALAIWRMERSRKRVLDTDVEGVVIGERWAPERAEGTLLARGVGPGGVRIVPESYILEIRTATDIRQLVVDAATFDVYAVGDRYPRAAGDS